MTSQPVTHGAIMELLQRLREEEGALEREYQDRLADLRRKIQAVETTLELLNPSETEEAPSIHREPVAPPSESTESSRAVPSFARPRPFAVRRTTQNEWAQKLRGLTQEEALRRIALENGGIIRSQDGKRILIEAGLAKGKPKNLTGSVYRKLAESGRYRWVSAGTFRLIGTEPQPEAPPPPEGQVSIFDRGV